MGQASDATIAMELGCDGVLVNTASTKAKKPFDMALAFKNAVIRQSFLSGRIEKNLMGFPPHLLKGLFSFFGKNFFLKCYKFFLNFFLSLRSITLLSFFFIIYIF